MSRAHLYDCFDSELCLIGAVSNSALIPEVIRLIRFLEHAPDVPLEDVAYTCARSARHMPAVIAVVATSVQDLHDRLVIAQNKLEEDAIRIRDKSGTYYFRDRLRPHGRIAFLFPGAVSFYPDMLRDICLSFDVCRSAFDELQAALEQTSATPVSDCVFPPAACYRVENSGEDSFAASVVAVHAANTALYRLFEQMGVTPDGLAGFSGGDFAALDAAGVYGDLTRNKREVFMREGYLMLTRLDGREDIPTCVMIATLDATRETVDALIAKHPGRISIAFFNSPRQLTLAIAPEIVAEVVQELSDVGIKTVQVPITEPFNTPWCAKALPTINQFLSHWVRHVPRIPVYSCATGERLPARPGVILRQTTDQWTQPIQFTATIRRMYDDGFRIFIELGARGNMTNAITETLKSLPHQAVAVNRIHRSGLAQLHHALGMLAAQGVQLDATLLHQHRRQRVLNFDKPLSAIVSPPEEIRLATGLPTFNVFSPSGEFVTAPRNPAESDRKPLPIVSDKRRLEFGADFPLLANADILEEQPGVLLEISKTLSLDDYPFLKGYAIGSSQISYSLPQLKGLTILSLISGMEMMCETARKLSPRLRVVQIDNLRSQRWIGFEHGSVRVILRAERIAWQDASLTAFRVQLRDDSPNSAYTWPIMDAVVLLSATEIHASAPTQPEPLVNPRPVNWSAHDIYPDRLFQGDSLQIIQHVDLWSEGGVDFEVAVPSRADAVRSTHFPLFSVWPILLDGIVSSFSLWRSHEKFAGAISMPFRARRITFYANHFNEGDRLKGYLRLFSVTPRSHVADIEVSDGNGHTLIEFKGWEELCERVPPEYQQFILRPSEKFITHPLPLELLGNPQTPVAASVATDIPFQIFEHNQELWLKALACVLLGPTEREEWLEMQGATARRVEWLFGRAVAKESTRRFLLKYHQARWTAADIPIWADDAGKPHPLGSWKEHTPIDLDLSIAHTSRLIVAAVVANASIGIDIEILGRNLSDEFTQGVFTHDELEIAASTCDAPVSILRFWCAKEAISKALGTGIRYSPRDLLITAYEPVSGQVTLELKNQWLAAFKQFQGRKNIIYTSLYEGHAFASCVLPSTLFQ
jgi:phosphopantetheine--protein transferase-like protein